MFLLILTSVMISATTPRPSPYHEVSPAVSFYTGDALRTTTLGSATYVFHLNRIYWLGIDFFGGALSADKMNGVGLKNGQKFFGLDGGIYFNLPALLSATPMEASDSLSADLYTSLGLGHMWIGRHKEVFGFVGGGLLIHPGIHWLGIRFDLKNLFFMLSNSQGNDFNSDMSLSLGPSFIF